MASMHSAIPELKNTPASEHWYSRASTGCLHQSSANTSSESEGSTDLATNEATICQKPTTKKIHATKIRGNGHNKEVLLAQRSGFIPSSGLEHS